MVDKISADEVKEIKQRVHRWGVVAEYMAMALLIVKGYRVLRLRYRSHYGEIDLIVQKKNMLVFVEVKARKKFDDAIGAVLPRQKMRIEKASLAFIQESKQYQNMDMRFDVVCCVPWKKPKHVPDAWRPVV